MYRAAVLGLRGSFGFSSPGDTQPYSI